MALVKSSTSTTTPVQQGLNRFHTWIEVAGLDAKEYQQDGVKWLLQHELDTPPHNTNTRGGLLADEMGLGKTIQILGLIYSNPLPHTLIVLPPALVSQWVAVIQRLFNHTAYVYHGNGRCITKASKSPVVITTYGMISSRKKNGITQYSPLTYVRWSRVIFDEAHHLRNENTSVFKGAMMLTSKIRWLMTGTPIQNRRADFYALCDVMGLPQEYSRNPNNLLKIAKHFILYRRKKDVGIELPEVKIHTIQVEWKNDDERVVLENLHSNFGFSGVRPSRYITNENKKGSALVRLLRARQGCVYPKMITSHFDDSIHSIEAEQMEQRLACGEELNELDKELLMIKQSLTGTSKMDAVIQTIADRKNNQRSKIVFCHFREEIDYIELCLTHKHSMNVEIVDGRTKTKQREYIFTNTNIDVLILQINTGCEGLNLQQYAEIYFVAPHWNPCVVDQAIARAHRIGQTQEVDVFHFVMNNFQSGEFNIENYCMVRQDAKRMMADELLVHTNQNLMLEKKQTQKSYTHSHDDGCAICMCELDCENEETQAYIDVSEVQDDDVVKSKKPHTITLECGHSYHMKCFKKMIQISEKPVNLSCCPMCRTQVSHKDIAKMMMKQL